MRKRVAGLDREQREQSDRAPGGPSTKGTTARLLRLQAAAGNHQVSRLITDCRAGTKGSDALPHRAAMERAFGVPLGDVPVEVGRSDVLGPLGASAMAGPTGVAFADSSPSAADVAHEVAHLLQHALHRARGSGQPARGIGASGTSAEIEADRMAHAAGAGHTGLHRNLHASPTALLQLRAKHIDRGRARAQAEREYHKKAAEYEFKLGTWLSTRPECIAIADELLGRLKQVIDAWASCTKQGKTEAYGNEFKFETSEKYYGSFKTTGDAIKQVFEKKSQPLRKKLNIVYYAVRGNTLAKYLEVAGLELVQAQGGNLGPVVVDVKGKQQTVKAGFAAQSGLAAHFAAVNPDKALRGPGEITAAEAANIATERRGAGKTPEVGVFSKTFSTQAPANQGRADKSYGKSEGLGWEEQPTLTRADLRDITADEVRLLQQRAGQKPSKWVSHKDKKKWAAQTTERVPWEMGVGNIEVAAGSETRRIADKYKARLDAGISGSTDLMMHAGVHLGMRSDAEKKQLRLALLAWMLSNRDHSLYEIMTAAAGYGVPFHLDQNRPGSEYEHPDNFAPLPAAAFSELARLMPGQRMPSYYLSDPYIDQLADAERTARKTRGESKDIAAAAGRVGATVAGMAAPDAAEYVAHHEALREVVRQAGLTAGGRTETELRTNRVKLQTLRDDPSYQWLALRDPLGAAYANRVVESYVHTAYPDALVTPADLEAGGVPRGVSEKVGFIERIDLYRLVVAVRSSQSARAAADQVPLSLPYKGVHRFLKRDGTRMVFRDLLARHFPGSDAIADEYFRKVRAPTRAAERAAEAAAEAKFLVSLGIPRAVWEENITGGEGRHDPSEPQGRASRASTIRLAVEHLRREIGRRPFTTNYANAWTDTLASASFVELRNGLKGNTTKQAEAEALGRAVAAKLVESVHGKTANAGQADQQKLATALGYRMSPADLQATGANHALDSAKLAALPTPAAFSASKLNKEKFWQSDAAEDKLNQNVQAAAITHLEARITANASSRKKAVNFLATSQATGVAAHLRDLAGSTDQDKRNKLAQLNTHYKLAIAQPADVTNRTETTIRDKAKTDFGGMTNNEIAICMAGMSWNDVKTVLGADHPFVASKEAAQALDPREKGAMFGYTTKLHEHLGYATQKMDVTSTATPADLTANAAGNLRGLDFALPLLQAMHSGMAKLPPYTGGPVYHGAAHLASAVATAAERFVKAKNTPGEAAAKKNFENKLAANSFQRGAILSFAYPFSTAKKPGKSFLAHGNKPLAYVIEQPVKSGKDIALLSDKPQEEEVLFPQGVRFVIRGASVDPPMGVASMPGVKLWVRVREA